jgi:hypothetical protein
MVNSTTYKNTLRPRYRHITIRPKNALSFKDHVNHSIYQSLLYVNVLDLDCGMCTNESDIKNCLDAAGEIPIHQLTCLNWRQGKGSCSAEVINSTLFFRQDRIRSLSLYPWPDNQPFPRIIPQFKNLRELQLCMFSSHTAISMNATDAARLLKMAGRQLDVLHIGRPDKSKRPRPIELGNWLEVFGGHSETPSKQLCIRKLMLQHFNSKEPPSLPWELLNCREIQSLAFENCFDIVSELHFFAGSTTAQSPWALTQLVVRLWDSCMEHGPEQLILLETFLADERLCSLVHLCIEIPNAQRLPSAGVIAKHSKLEILAVNATNTDGWWLVFNPAELLNITANCLRISCLSCTIPALEDEEFYVSTASTPKHYGQHNNNSRKASGRQKASTASMLVDTGARFRRLLLGVGRDVRENGRLITCKRRSTSLGIFSMGVRCGELDQAPFVILPCIWVSITALLGKQSLQPSPSLGILSRQFWVDDALASLGLFG